MASAGVIRGNVDSLMQLVAALDAAGIDLIAEGAASSDGGRGVRLKRTSLSAGALPPARPVVVPVAAP